MSAATMHTAGWTSVPTGMPVHYPSTTYRSVTQYHPTAVAAADTAYTEAAAQRPYEPYTPRDDGSVYASGHSRMHSIDDEAFAAKKRTRQRMYPNEEAKQAAKALQKARRREQNRNAQRRLRDRKEEHIFKLEGEVAQLRRQTEQHRSEVQGLEEMIRRLMEQRSELRSRLEALGAPASVETEWPMASMSEKSSVRLAPLVSLPPIGGQGQVGSPSGSRALRKPVELPNGNALGLSEYDPPSHAAWSSASPSVAERDRSVVSPTQSSASSSSASVATPRSPSFLGLAEPRSRSITTPSLRTKSVASHPIHDSHLHRIKPDPHPVAPFLPPSLMPLPPVSAPWPQH